MFVIHTSLALTVCAASGDRLAYLSPLHLAPPFLTRLITAPTMPLSNESPLPEWKLRTLVLFRVIDRSKTTQDANSSTIDNELLVRTTSSPLLASQCLTSSPLPHPSHPPSPLLHSPSSAASPSSIVPITFQMFTFSSQSFLKLKRP